MDKSRIEYHILPGYANYPGNGTAFFLDKYDFEAQQGYRGEITWHKVEPYDERTADLTLDKERTQKLFDALWASGLRPSDGDCSIGQIGAIKDHLKDMRTITSNLLGVELEGKK